MEIVVLDGYTLNPGDLSWDDLRSLGTCTFYERTSAGEIVPRSKNAEVLLTNKTPITAETLAQLPRLRFIGVLATGYNIVDVTAARNRAIPVCNVPDYGTPSVAQHVFALILELTQSVGAYAQTVRQGRWTRSADFCYYDSPIIELNGLTLGVIGAGRIGNAVANLGRAFGMKVSLTDQAEGRAGLENVLKSSDVVTLHCPLTPETNQMIDHEALSLMKPSAFLINTARGPLVDQEALAGALNCGRIAGAGLDVLAVEPPPPDNPLLNAKNCLITPHIAWASQAARKRLMRTVVENVRAFLAGTPQNVVN
ncbi:MAG TPA: D-2-hydroxyacid dehydrogenase [Verrucomicrobiae bacterium]|nr:D-2-hydroxyacid dehydrogenase [Verrucomicrobiae bacterium]